MSLRGWWPGTPEKNSFLCWSSSFSAFPLKLLFFFLLIYKHFSFSCRKGKVLLIFPLRLKLIYKHFSLRLKSLAMKSRFDKVFSIDNLLSLQLLKDWSCRESNLGCQVRSWKLYQRSYWDLGEGETKVGVNIERLSFSCPIPAPPQNFFWGGASIIRVIGK